MVQGGANGREAALADGAARTVLYLARLIPIEARARFRRLDL